MNCFCTIITSDYNFYAKVIYDSLKKYNNSFSFFVLVVDEGTFDFNYESIQYINLNSLKNALPSEFSTIIKYEADKKSALRWALKPLFLKYLIQNHQMNKAVFVDPDLCFYNDPSFIFKMLDNSDVLLTPHWRSKDPFADSTNFELLFTGGLFNAGFFACNKASINILDWWLKVCSYKMEKHGGFYVDQAYLNLLPIYFKNQVEVLEHRGCNVSNWNLLENKRTLVENKVLINEKYPVVFIHFTNATINMIAKGKDKLLKPHLENYKKMIMVHNPKFQFNYEKESSSLKSAKTSLFNRFIKKLRNK